MRFTRLGNFGRVLTSLLCIWSIGVCSGQIVEDSISRKVLYELGTGVIASTSSATPFWFKANQFGTISKQNPSLNLHGKIYSDFSGSKWDWAYGIEAWGNAGKENRFILPEAYIAARFHRLKLSAGRRRQVIGIVGDSLLTSGSYIQSGNNTPIPQVQLGFLEYVPILKGLFSFKGYLSHGWFDKNAVVENHYLHQKSIYVKVGKDRWPVALIGGFNHNVQWGGTIIKSNRWTVGKKNPQEWIDYWYVFTGKRIPTFGYVDPTKYDLIDRGNRVGNHLGTIDIAIELRFQKALVCLYRQSIFDDGSLYQKANIQDGLHGLSVKFPKSSGHPLHISGIVAEFMYTGSQGGNVFTLDGGPRGRDNYFNHIQYEGWVYQGNTIGTPFITPKTDTPDLPAPSSFFYSNNNRIRLFHLGVSGAVNTIEFLCKLSYSNNLGTYDRPFPVKTNQFSGLAEIKGPLHLKGIGDVEGRIGLATDFGALYSRSTGLHVSLIKMGILGKVR